ncbi:MAG TPA: ComEC/Rec2 family competence protein [Solirubrobacterales bacterium]|nr:ComEC/Rec2 family competence protein [Solirubrobacterales bacterium]
MLVTLTVLAAVGLALAHADQLKERASTALGQGMPEREAELARGFVLGEDERIDPATEENFRRSGLAHLIAVSGQNVALLALLAMPLLAALGMSLRVRLLWVLGLIALYVPLAGAGPSIQRAGVMGGLSVLATLAGRRSSRLYALAVAATVTLAVDPGIGSDVGWQLSFAAVLGILFWAQPLRRWIAARSGARGPLGRMLAEGAAMTVAATLATAPLIAFHFGELSTTTLVANLLALPAVAPAMWLGMLAAAAGQLPGLPLDPLNQLNALLLAYIAQVASWCGRPSWAMLEVRLGLGGLVSSYLGIALATVTVPWLVRRRRVSSLRQGPPARRTRSPAALPVLLAVAVALGVLALAVAPGRGGGKTVAPPSGLRVSFLDVGQGDAVLLQPANAAPVLVDGGPPGARVAEQLAAAGVERLGAVVVTHDQSDHAGGIEELLGHVPVERFVYAVAGRELRVAAAAAGAVPLRLAAGDELRTGKLHLEAIWPPRELLGEGGAGADPNERSLVLLARWRDFTALLAADAEAEAAPLDPGPVDVLKVAHHGSEDAGLDALLGRMAPALALISVGEENTYGHPAPATLATLAAHGVRTLRTDRDGAVVLDVGRGRIEASAGD